MNPVKHKRVLALFASVILLALPAGAQTPITADQLPRLQFLDENQRTLSLQQYQGRPILLHLWATWCAPCVREIPLLVRLQADYAAYGLVLLPVSQDFAAEDIRRFYRNNGILNLPLLLDRDSSIFKAVGTRGLPISILIDRYGNEMRRFAGNTNWDSPQVRGMLNELLAR